MQAAVCLFCQDGFSPKLFRAGNLEGQWSITTLHLIRI